MFGATGSDTEVPGLSVLRVIRMVRVLQLLKMSKGVMLFAETMQKSFKPLNMLFMILAVVIIVASALMYFIERGQYNFKMQYWERPVAYRCAVYLTSTAAMGASPTYQAGEGRAAFAHLRRRRSAQRRVPLHVPGHRKNPNCVTVYEQSPFNSILHSFWWSWVSMCTVGYGGVNPATILGKTFGMIVVVVGVLVIALPVTVIGATSPWGSTRRRRIARWRRRNFWWTSGDVWRRRRR